MLKLSSTTGRTRELSCKCKQCPKWNLSSTLGVGVGVGVDVDRAKDEGRSRVGVGCACDQHGKLQAESRIRTLRLR